MSAANAAISVVVRTRAADRQPLTLLAALSRQRRPPDEVVLIDSGSAPEVRDALRAAARSGIPCAGRGPIPLRLIEIDPAEYASASALNAAIAATRGGRVAILSQDALPAGPDYLARLAAALEDEATAGAYGRQVPRAGASPIAAKDLALTYPARSRTQRAPDCRFVNTCSMIRREVWSELPFETRAVITEDHRWAQQAQARGYVVHYVAEALVRHHHDYRSAREVWRRYYDEGRGIGYVYGRAPRLAGALGDALREVASDGWWLLRRRRPAAWPRAAWQRAVKHAALYCGLRRCRAAAATANGNAIAK